MNDFTCGYCGYKWGVRVELPKSCPACHRYFVDKANVHLYEAKNAPKKLETKGEASTLQVGGKK